MQSKKKQIRFGMLRDFQEFILKPDLMFANYSNKAVCLQGSKEKQLRKSLTWLVSQEGTPSLKSYINK